MTYTVVTSLARKADRDRFLSDLQDALNREVPEANLTRWLHKDREIAIGYAIPGQLGVSFSHMARESVPLLHWHGARDRLTGVMGAWNHSDINRFHGCKATSFPFTLDDLIARMVTGLRAAVTGEAFAEREEV